MNSDKKQFQKALTSDMIIINKFAMLHIEVLEHYYIEFMPGNVQPEIMIIHVLLYNLGRKNNNHKTIYYLLVIDKIS